jgi:hypothetical protein
MLDEQQASLRGRQGTVLRGGIASRLPAPPVEGPDSHVPQEGLLKGRYQRSTRIDGQTRQISHRGGVGWEIAIL